MNQTENVLNGFYKNAVVGIEAIEGVIEKSENSGLTGELSRQLCYYKEQKEKLKEQMLRQAMTPSEQGTAAKFFTDMNIMMHSIGGMESTEIAKLMVQGTNMGIIQMTQLMNRNTAISGDIKRQGAEMIRREESYIEHLKPYL